MQPGMWPRTLWQPAWHDKCEIQLAYAIGVAHPVSINVNTFGTGKVEDEVLAKAVEKVFDLRPDGHYPHAWTCAGPSTVSWQPTVTSDGRNWV